MNIDITHEERDIIVHEFKFSLNRIEDLIRSRSKKLESSFDFMDLENLLVERKRIENVLRKAVNLKEE